MRHCPIRNDECAGGYKTEAQTKWGDIQAGCAWWDYKRDECLVRVLLEKILSALPEEESK